MNIISATEKDHGYEPSAVRDTTDICDILRLWRDNSTNKYYCTKFVIFEFH